LLFTFGANGDDIFLTWLSFENTTRNPAASYLTIGAGIKAAAN
jgi:hypothetical protein